MSARTAARPSTACIDDRPTSPSRSTSRITRVDAGPMCGIFWSVPSAIEQRVDRHVEIQHRRGRALVAPAALRRFLHEREVAEPARDLAIDVSHPPYAASSASATARRTDYDVGPARRPPGPRTTADRSRGTSLQRPRPPAWIPPLLAGGCGPAASRRRPGQRLRPRPELPTTCCSIPSSDSFPLRRAECGDAPRIPADPVPAAGSSVRAYVSCFSASGGGIARREPVAVSSGGAVAGCPVVAA